MADDHDRSFGDDESPGTFKGIRGPADRSEVDTQVDGRQRWNWDSVTNSGEIEPPTGDRPIAAPSFQFDLGGALARLGGAPNDDRTVPAADVVEGAGAGPTAIAGSSASETIETAAPGMPLDGAAPAVVPPAAAESRGARVAGEVDGAGARPVTELSPGPSATVPAPQLSASTPTEVRPPRETAPQVAASETPDPLPRRQRHVVPPVAEPPAVVQMPQVVEPAVVQVPPAVHPTPVVGPAPPQPAARAGSVFGPVGVDANSYRSSPETPSLPNSTMPGVGGSPVFPLVGDGLPRLPPANPAAPPPTVAVIQSAPSTPDIVALRSAQLRASRQQRSSKVFGRVFLVFVVVGAVLGAALVFGRSLLFPTEWDASLTPIVDDIQTSLGVEFDRSVPLVTLPVDEYGTRLVEQLLGTGWLEAVPQWRALGVAGGDVTVDSVGAQLTPWRPAYFDPTTETIYQATGADPETVGPALTSALTSALQHQLRAVTDDQVVSTSEIRLTGVSSPQDLARGAVDAYLVARAAEQASGQAPTVTEPAGLPLPIAYQLAAVDRLGAAMLTAAGAEPDGLRLTDAPPDGVYAALDEQPGDAPPAILTDGARPLADPIALGSDDWSLVWGARLPAVTVDRLAGLVTGDSYQPLSRGSVQCFVGTFSAPTDAAAAFVLTSMVSWAQRVPSGALAQATSIAPTVVQLEACDPGVTAESAPDASSISRLIDRQIKRLAP